MGFTPFTIRMVHVMSLMYFHLHFYHCFPACSNFRKIQTFYHIFFN